MSCIWHRLHERVVAGGGSADRFGGWHEAGELQVPEALHLHASGVEHDHDDVVILEAKKAFLKRSMAITSLLFRAPECAKA